MSQYGNYTDADGTLMSNDVHTLTRKQQLCHDAQKWIHNTGAIGMIPRQGKYVAAYAHKDIAFEFASCFIQNSSCTSSRTIFDNAL
jgi:hypothetical protein